MLLQLTPKDISREIDIILAVVEDGLPEYYDRENPHWKWHFFTKTQLDNIQVWKMFDGEGDDVKVYGYIVTRYLIDDIFMESMLLLYGFNLFEKPSAEFLVDNWHKLEEWAKARGINRIEAISSSPLMERIATAFNFIGDMHFVKSLRR